MEPASVSAVTAKLMFTGFCLALGFWTAKKLTNKLDYLLFTRSEEYQRFVRERNATERITAADAS